MERSRLLWEDFLLLRLEIECLTIVKKKRYLEKLLNSCSVKLTITFLLTLYTLNN